VQDTVSEFEFYHLIRAHPAWKAAEQADREFRSSPLGCQAVIAEIEDRLGDLDPDSRDRYDAGIWNLCVTRERIRTAITRDCEGCGAEAGEPCRWGCLSWWSGMARRADD
jgi:hypothetical protein